MESRLKKHIFFAILAMGFSGIVTQILLLREFITIFSGNEICIGVILANWLILEAAGSFFLGKRIERVKKKIETFVFVQLIFSLSLPFAIFSIRSLYGLIVTVPGEAVGLLSIFCSSFIVLIPVCVTHGALFTFSCSIYSKFFKNHNSVIIGKVYIYETLGTILGGIFFVYPLILYFNSFQIAFIIAVLNLSICLFLLHPLRNSKIVNLMTCITIIFLLLICFLLFGNNAEKIHFYTIEKKWRGLNVVHYHDSIYGNIAAIKQKNQYTFFLNGVPVITTPTPDIIFVEEFVHFPMLLHPKPAEILILSGGAGGVINEILKHKTVKRIDYAELDP